MLHYIAWNNCRNLYNVFSTVSSNSNSSRNVYYHYHHHRYYSEYQTELLQPLTLSQFKQLQYLQWADQRKKCLAPDFEQLRSLNFNVYPDHLFQAIPSYTSEFPYTPLYIKGCKIIYLVIGIPSPLHFQKGSLPSVIYSIDSTTTPKTTTALCFSLISCLHFLTRTPHSDMSKQCRHHISLPLSHS